jgi:hypothetical protein
MVFTSFVTVHMANPLPAIASLAGPPATKWRATYTLSLTAQYYRGITVP